MCYTLLTVAMPRFGFPNLTFTADPPSLSAISGEVFRCFPKKGIKSFFFTCSPFWGNSSQVKKVLFAGLDKDLCIVYQAFSRQKDAAKMAKLRDKRFN